MSGKVEQHRTWKGAGGPLFSKASASSQSPGSLAGKESACNGGDPG